MYYLLAQEYLNGILLDNWMIKNPITGKNHIYDNFSLAFSDSKKYCHETHNREVRVIVVHSKTKIES
jgi:hypothetical protein